MEGSVVRVKTRAGPVSFHPGCWLELAEGAADSVGTPGRRALGLEPEDAATRRSLLCRYAAVKQRIKVYEGRLATDPASPTLPLMILRARLKMEEYKVRIDGVGGVPRRWEVAG
jgi:hypothetical protein